MGWILTDGQTPGFQRELSVTRGDEREAEIALLQRDGTIQITGNGRLLAHYLSALKYVKEKTRGLENRRPPFCQICIIFTHLKLWIASARHNFKWVKSPIEKFYPSGPDYIRSIHFLLGHYISSFEHVKIKVTQSKIFKNR